MVTVNCIVLFTALRRPEREADHQGNLSDCTGPQKGWSHFRYLLHMFSVQILTLLYLCCEFGSSSRQDPHIYFCIVSRSVLKWPCRHLASIWRKDLGELAELLILRCMRLRDFVVNDGQLWPLLLLLLSSSSSSSSSSPLCRVSTHIFPRQTMSLRNTLLQLFCCCCCCCLWCFCL
jgi:hypothetical protein